MASLRTLDLLAKQAKKEKEAVKNKTEKTVEEIIVKKEEIKEQKIIQLEIKIKKEPVVWDVKIGDSIEYFDPDLSYELTGYRPIDENRGLDFDPLPFSENAKIYETTGYYTTYVKGFKLYDDFWRELVRRCKDGYTVNDYTITGDHYFFLNFYRIKSPVKGAGSTDGSNFGETFPTFCVELYKWFHYLALCEKLNLDANALKPRAVGWSEIAASMGLRNYTIKRKSQGIYTAFNSDMLGPTISKVWDGMEFLNTCTGGGLKHLRMVKNTADIKRASLKLKDGTEVGFKSEIRTVITDNPRKLRGSRVERLFFEEAGSHPELLRTYTQAEALVEIGGTKVGIRLSWGTGGDHGPALAGLATIFYNPEAYKVLPYRNNFNMKREYVLTGFFIPAYHMVWNKMDHRGFCSEAAGREYYDKERMRKSKDAQALMAFKSEFCYFPEEALIREGSNRFDAEKIAEQITNIELHKTVELPIRGRLSWPLNKETGNIDMNQTPVFTPDQNGKILITEYPMSDDKGIVYNLLYVSGLDSIDSDTSSSSGQSDVSDFCILIKKRTFGLSEPKYVAMYKDRPRDIRTAYDNAIKLLMWYNAKCVVEATRVGIITYFKEKNKLNLLFKRPRATLANLATRNINLYGTPATPAIIEHQLELIEMFIQDYCYSILFLEMLLELLKYSYENKRKFDIVAAMGLTELADEELFSRPPRALNNISNNWKDIGYYYDNGVKKFGVIPTNYNKEDNMIRNNYDWIRI